MVPQLDINILKWIGKNMTKNDNINNFLSSFAVGQFLMLCMKCKVNEFSNGENQECLNSLLLGAQETISNYGNVS